MAKPRLVFLETFLEALEFEDVRRKATEVVVVDVCRLSVLDKGCSVRGDLREVGSGTRVMVDSDFLVDGNDKR